MKRLAEAAELIGEFAIVMAAYVIISRILTELNPYLAR